MSTNKENNLEKKDEVVTSPHSEREERILKQWIENKTFEKSLEKDAPKGDFVFYDGPPFANGLPHYGHMLASIIKDVIPRWKTMQGYRVERRWGWDCHGLPVENLIERELDLKSKKDIFTYGIGKFNDEAKKSVMRYADEWRKIIPRIGRWVDMENDYRTMDTTYTETVWWIFKNLFDKGLIYEGFKSMFLCPRCETTLSNFEVAQGYKDITDISVYVKFEIEKGDKILNGNDTKTYFLAWTTTPWTLPGNVALAVNPETEYVKIKMSVEADNQEYCLIMAKSRLSVLKDKKYEEIDSFKGNELIGVKYKSLFNYYSEDKKIKNIENGWKVYGAEFVTTEDGTGVVHIAPAFGADDYELLLKYNLPFIQHVTTDGKFKEEVKDFAGMYVKPIDTAENKNAHQSADIEVIKWLTRNGSLFEKEKLIHSYPHCWRCDTPLLNYASSSWFVKVTDIKDKLYKENQKITWVPEEIGESRFGNWLLGARDWSISRSRFWGAPIPVWRAKKSGKIVVIGSISDIKKHAKAKNEYLIMRHGEAMNNTDAIISSDPLAPHHLSEKGRKQVVDATKNTLLKDVDIVYSSPFVRTKETTEILTKALNWKEDMIKIDSRIGELDAGEWNGRKVNEFFDMFEGKDRFTEGPEKGENFLMINKRVGDFLYDMEAKYSGKKILIITHEIPSALMSSISRGLNRDEIMKLWKGGEAIANAEIKKLDFSPLPHNDDFELDLHKPFIDNIELSLEDGDRLSRVPDVFDCWFESGSMPYGKAHYPFENKDKFDPHPGLLKKSKGFPADFIAEGLDQTRGWFYSMLVIGVALFGKSPYEKVIVNGLVLAEDGQKMSKRKKNYPDPMYVISRYGADSLRFYMLSSPVVEAQDLCFSERGVDEVTKKIINRILNVVTFFETYGDKGNIEILIDENKFTPISILDQWILFRFNQLIEEVTDNLEQGYLDKATRPFMGFIDDFSTWYLRRSRDRFKGEDVEDRHNALKTTRYVLIELSKALAPFTPFLAEEIYSKVSGTKDSVHLQSWPIEGNIDSEVIENMRIVREISSLGLEARMRNKINVRQPLAKLYVKGDKGRQKFLELKENKEYIEIIKSEVNVKEITVKDVMENETELDTNITPDLKEEGMIREMIRTIQDIRKEGGFSVEDEAIITVETLEDGRAFLDKNKTKIFNHTMISDMKYGNIETEAIIIGQIEFKIGIIKK